MTPLGQRSHLGQRLDALVDGELGHDERDRALAHVSRCPQCRAELHAARQVKARLTALSAPSVPDSLTSRLLALAAADGADGAAGSAPAGPRRAPLPLARPLPDGPGALVAGALPAPRPLAGPSRRVVSVARGLRPVSASAMGLALGAAVLVVAPVSPHTSNAAAHPRPSSAVAPRPAGLPAVRALRMVPVTIPSASISAGVQQSAPTTARPAWAVPARSRSVGVLRAPGRWGR
ncbi:anti-sigma factor family protein [Motilibacter aurantiacus]|uniref:anti-sigma factor family protein n=1 Tax=Motilibacter aurantiacus TaxID=2714955 RepID=UPI00140D28C7|nr:zf-HC2 domain-containing protein [Motilibacter aurantiacus]NHC45727.1 hypothetical protein [Motilibacter aurantiacus]